MHVLLVGLNHKTAPVEVREQVAVTGHHLPDTLSRLAARDAVQESVILSTCNRTELYAVAQNSDLGIQTLTHFFQDLRRQDPAAVERALYRQTGSGVVRHLFRVASGLDSLVMGEGQVLGQVKQAYHIALEARTTGPVLNRLFPMAIQVGKKARTDTAITQGAASISAAAIELARQIFGNLAGARVLLLGAGEVSEGTLKQLKSSGVRVVLVANRTFDRARELAMQFDGQAVQFDALEETLADTDIVLASTAAPHAVLTRDAVAAAMRRRKNRPLFLIDLAVPRDIEPDVDDLENVYLYNIDDLQGVVAANLQERRQEVAKVEAMIEEHHHEFFRYFKTLDVVPLIKALRDQADAGSRTQLESILTGAAVTPEERGRLEELRRRLVAQWLHGPILKIKELAHQHQDDALLMIRDMFGISPPDGAASEDLGGDAPAGKEAP